MGNEGVIGLLSFLSFGFSVIAAVLAIDTYALLRTGQSGGTWRVLIIASVIFALMQALRLAEILDLPALSGLHLSEIVELMFVISLTYAFYLQRRIFQGKATRSTPHKNDERVSEDSNERALDEDDDIVDDLEVDELESSQEWARLNGLPTSESNSSDDGDDGDAADRRANQRRAGDRRSSI